MDLSAITDDTLSVVIPLLRQQSKTNKRASFDKIMERCRNNNIPHEPVLALMGWRPQRGTSRRAWMDLLTPTGRTPDMTDDPLNAECAAAYGASDWALSVPR